MSKYPNVDYFYSNHKDLLLESDRYRLCKSIPRDVQEYVTKFANYYSSHDDLEAGSRISKDTVTRKILEKDSWKDTDNTAKRIMEEIGFLVVKDEEFEFTEAFDSFVKDGANFQQFLIDQLNGIHSMKEMTMFYNSIISALREGYLYGQIMEFPDSKEKFKKAITNPDDRQKMKERVYSVYGFAGRWRNVDDDYTPNANYRILTTLRLLSFIDQIPSEIDDVRMYRLTQYADDYLQRLNSNLGDISEEEFEDLIAVENNYEKNLKRLAEQYGIDGTMEVTHQTRLPQVQMAFRDRLIRTQGQKCLMCNITNKDMLIASHIRRAADENIFGKADYNNGLLLCANHDRLFDKYLISFHCINGALLVSKSLTEHERQLCGLDEKYCLPEELLTEERMEYLMDHNEMFYKKESERE